MTDEEIYNQKVREQRDKMIEDMRNAFIYGTGAQKSWWEQPKRAKRIRPKPKADQRVVALLESLL